MPPEARETGRQGGGEGGRCGERAGKLAGSHLALPRAVDMTIEADHCECDVEIRAKVMKEKFTYAYQPKREVTLIV